MEIGWMWFDSDQSKSLKEKVDGAVQAFHQKFGRWPNVCYVNQRAVEGDGFTCGRVRVIAASNILPDHFWLGVTAKAA